MSLLHKFDLVKFHSTCVRPDSNFRVFHPNFLVYRYSRLLVGCFSSFSQTGYFTWNEARMNEGESKPLWDSIIWKHCHCCEWPCLLHGPSLDSCHWFLLGKIRTCIWLSQMYSSLICSRIISFTSWRLHPLSCFLNLWSSNEQKAALLMD